MTMNANETYQIVAKAIRFIKYQARQQPDLDDVAKAVHLSPHHFQKTFRQWAGVSPKKFLQFITADHAKQLLLNGHSNQEAAWKSGLSGTGRLHDLFIRIEGMSPGEYKQGGRHLRIHYGFSESPFGEMLCAATERGICNLMFIDDRSGAVDHLHTMWPEAEIRRDNPAQIPEISSILNGSSPEKPLHLHLSGTSFQLKVWEALLKIPSGRLTTYSDIAGSLHRVRASRAVGTAVGRNPVAYLIPCHRVIKKTGDIGEYRWGSVRKTAMIGWESLSGCDY